MTLQEHASRFALALLTILVPGTLALAQGECEKDCITQPTTAIISGTQSTLYYLNIQVTPVANSPKGNKDCSTCEPCKAKVDIGFNGYGSYCGSYKHGLGSGGTWNPWRGLIARDGNLTSLCNCGAAGFSACDGFRFRVGQGHCIPESCPCTDPTSVEFEVEHKLVCECNPD